jgi:hypothetical protein
LIFIFIKPEDSIMQSNIEERGLTGTRRTCAERIAFSAFGAFCRGILAVTDSRKFMIVMHTVSFSTAAVCLVMAFKTGRYADYFANAGTIACLSFLWPEFTTRAVDKRRKAMNEKCKRE